MNKEDNLIHTAIVEGDDMFLQILKDYPQMDDDDHRQETLMLNLMTNCVARLHILGWTERELCNEVVDWCKIAQGWSDKYDLDE